MHFRSLAACAAILFGQVSKPTTAYPLDACVLHSEQARNPSLAFIAGADGKGCSQVDKGTAKSKVAAVFATRESSLQVPLSNHNAAKGTEQQRSSTLKGYVAFGDSFAAGMGTGDTNWTDCRRGEFSYPSIVASTAGQDAYFQNLPCSGATMQCVLSGSENSQIDAWINASHTDFGTLTIGGNDVGFYNILTACVVRVGGVLAGSCDEEVANAYGILYGSDFSNNLENIFRQIIKKSDRPDFKLYAMGYPHFFNAEQEDCDHVTFGIWDTHHNWGPQHDFSAAWLYQDLRAKLNNLTANLNSEISRAVHKINFELGKNNRSPQISFIDPNAAFEHHRFCEIDGKEDVREPDSERRDTWFFLDGCSDILLKENTTIVAQAWDNNVLEFLDSTMTLPDPKTCKKEMATAGTHDWAGTSCITFSLHKIPYSTILHG